MPPARASAANTTNNNKCASADDIAFRRSAFSHTRALFCQSMLEDVGLRIGKQRYRLRLDGEPCWAFGRRTHCQSRRIEQRHDRRLEDTLELVSRAFSGRRTEVA